MASKGILEPGNLLLGAIIASGIGIYQFIKVGQYLAAGACGIALILLLWLTARIIRKERRREERKNGNKGYL